MQDLENLILDIQDASLNQEDIAFEESKLKESGQKIHLDQEQMPLFKLVNQTQKGEWI